MNLPPGPYFKVCTSCFLRAGFVHGNCRDRRTPYTRPEDDELFEWLTGETDATLREVRQDVTPGVIEEVTRYRETYFSSVRINVYPRRDYRIVQPRFLVRSLFSCFTSQALTRVARCGLYLHTSAEDGVFCGQQSFETSVWRPKWLTCTPKLVITRCSS